MASSRCSFITHPPLGHRNRGSPLYLMVIVVLVITTLIAPALATNYTHFDDLPKCGKACIGKDAIHDAVSGNRGNCPLDLACVCQSQYYNVGIDACLMAKGKDPCNKDDPMRKDIIAFKDNFWCNPESDARMTFETKIGGHAVTFTLPPPEETPEPETESTVSATTATSTSSTATKSADVATSVSESESESESASPSSVPTSKTSHDATSTNVSHGNLTSTATAIVTATATATAMITATHDDQANATDTGDSVQATISEPAAISSSNPGDDGNLVTSTVHVTACTTVMGNTVTVHTTTNVVATAIAANDAGPRVRDNWVGDGLGFPLRAWKLHADLVSAVFTIAMVVWVLRP